MNQIHQIQNYEEAFFSRDMTDLQEILNFKQEKKVEKLLKLHQKQLQELEQDLKGLLKVMKKDQILSTISNSAHNANFSPQPFQNCNADSLSMQPSLIL